MELDADPNSVCQTEDRVNRRLVPGLARTVGLATFGGLRSGLVQESDDTRDDCRLGGETASRTVNAAEESKVVDSNTAPVVGNINEEPPGLHVRDAWSLHNRGRSVASMDGWSIHSREGRDWQLGGPPRVSGTVKGQFSGATQVAQLLTRAYTSGLAAASWPDAGYCSRGS